VQDLRRALIDVLAYLEAQVDFDEEYIPPQDISSPLAEAQDRLEELLEGADQGIIYRQGVRTAIIGRPNVGKSSLLNALLGTGRAIVTPIPGTTRDTLEETINLRGIPVVLVDTAGIADTDDLVESLGVERSRQALEGADLVLLVADGSEPWRDADDEIAGLVRGKPAILVTNKADLSLIVEPRGLPAEIPQVVVSALTGEGMRDLQEAMFETITSGRVVSSEQALVANPRHRDILRWAAEHLAAARESERQGMPADFICIDLTAAVNALGEITGETASEDLLEAIFSNFCLGK
jgi:tRNA modification GTPase